MIFVAGEAIIIPGVSAATNLLATISTLVSVYIASQVDLGNVFDIQEVRVSTRTHCMHRHAFVQRWFLALEYSFTDLFARSFGQYLSPEFSNVIHESLPAASS